MQASSVLGIVPARGGSKRVLRKNLRLLGGKPLICHTLEAALDSRAFSDVMLSSDDDEILEIAKGYDDVVVDRREACYATDQATVFSLVASIVARAGFKDRYDAVALLLPTAPFRQAQHICECLALLDEATESVVSVTLFEFPPQFGLFVDSTNSNATPAWSPSPLLSGQTRSQDQQPVYHPNGAIYVAWWDAYCRRSTFYGEPMKGYLMSREASIDIDTEADLEYAQYLFQRAQDDGAGGVREINNAC
jgi:CMP-N-acetylneuraminic acid synthetase